MGESNRLRLRDVRAALRLAGEVLELGPDAFAWRERLFEGLRRQVGASVAVGGESEGLFGLDAKAHPLQYFYSGFNLHDQRVHQAYMARADFIAIDPTIPRFVRARRTLMTRSHEQLTWRREWLETVIFNEYFRPLRMDDRIFSFCRMTNEGSRSLWNGVTLERALGDPPFTARERSFVHLVHRELRPWMGKRLATCRGRQDRRLSPRQRTTLDLLLLGRSEKQIAKHCSLAQSTVHEYITALYRRYRVSGRAELMALFLGWQGLDHSDSGSADNGT